MNAVTFTNAEFPRVTFMQYMELCIFSSLLVMIVRKMYFIVLSSSNWKYGSLIICMVKSSSYCLRSAHCCILVVPAQGLYF